MMFKKVPDKQCKDCRFFNVLRLNKNFGRCHKTTVAMVMIPMWETDIPMVHKNDSYDCFEKGE